MTLSDKVQRSIKAYQEKTGDLRPHMGMLNQKQQLEAQARRMLAEIRHELAGIRACISAKPANKVNAQAKPAKVVRAVKVLAFKPLTPAKPEPFANSVRNIRESWRRGVSIGF